MEMILFRKGEKFIVLYDECDYELLSTYHWYVSSQGYVLGYLKNVPNISKRSVFMHRVILGILHAPNIFSDHINGVRTDNRRCNLRLCSKQQNSRNAKSFGKSKFKGVNPKLTTSGTTTFIASITVNGKLQHLGSFSTEKEAAIAYDQAARKLFGQFAHLNFPDEQQEVVGRKRIPSSGFRGVYVNRINGCTYIHAMIKGKHIGSFTSKTDAARAYNEAAIKLFGERAVLNDI